jgi:hypothetical protein
VTFRHAIIGLAGFQVKPGMTGFIVFVFSGRINKRMKGDFYLLPSTFYLLPSAFCHLSSAIRNRTKPGRKVAKGDPRPLPLSPQKHCSPN